MGDYHHYSPLGLFGSDMAPPRGAQWVLYTNTIVELPARISREDDLATRVIDSSPTLFGSEGAQPYLFC